MNNEYILEYLKNITDLINNHPICADDIVIIANHFLYLCEQKALHGESLKKYLNENFKIKNKNMTDKTFKLNAKYPVYNDNDEIIGETSKDDIAIVSFHYIGNEFNPFDKEYIHMELLSGQFKGYDALQLDEEDGDFNKLEEVKLA